jgi:hypothetical protein
MHYPKSSVALTFLSIPLAASSLGAQSTRPSPAEANDAKPESALVLNPFVVSTEKDTGYAGSSTLAGTRLNTPVADLGAAISIFTKDFLDDIGATSTNDLLIYATGMEAGGPGGNFSGAAGSNIANESVFSDASRNEPQTVTRARGVGTPNISRNYFNSDIASDAYIIESVTVNRGPNASLFGVGNAAGVVESGVLRADVSRNRNRVQFRYGDNDSLRANVDFNRVLIRNKLAVRIAALHDEERFQQRPAFEKKRRVFGAINFEPFKTTSIRGDFEAGRTTANRPFTGLPFNSISDEWWATGMPLYDWTLFDDPVRLQQRFGLNAATTPAPTQGGANSRFQDYANRGLMSRTTGQGQVFGGNILVFNSHNATQPAIGFPATGMPATTGTAANAIRSNVFDPVFNRDSAADTAVYIETLNVAEIYAETYPGNLKPAGIKMQGFRNYDAFDWMNRQIDETGRQGDTFNTVNVNLEQRGWDDRVGLALAYFNQRYSNWNRNAFLSTQGNANHVRIDPNVRLPNGQPNPNVGRPFVAFQQTADGNSVRGRSAGRATAYLRYDFKDISPKWGKWIGRHALTGLVEQVDADIVNYSTRMTNQVNNGVISTGFNNRPYMMVYVGPSVLDGTPLTLNPIQLPRFQDGFTAQTLFPSAEAGSTAQATFTTVPNVFREIHNGTTGSREVIKSQASVLHSYWLDNLLVTTLGWRRDEGYLSRLNLPANVNNKLAWGRNDFDFADTPPPNASKEVKTFSAVLRWPQRLVRLPRGMNASVFTNVSENFTPAGTRVDFNNESLPSPAGKTREIGFNLSFFDNKLSLRYNKFETSTRGATLSGGPLGNMFNNSILQVISLLVADQNNPGNQGTIDRRPAINAMLAPLPRYREAINFQMSGTGTVEDPLTTSWTPLGVSDTTDIVSKGHELELVFNPTRQLRLLANVANQEAVQSNIAPVTRELVNLMLPVWTGDLVGNSPRGGFPNVRAYVTETSLTPYYSLIETEGISTAEVRKWRANFVANYTFARTSKLRGWGVGTGIRWQDKVAIGYPTSRRPDGTVALDRANPYYGPTATNVDGWLSYGRRVWKDRIDWKIQLNIRNMIGSDELIAINAQPDGSVASYRLPPERRWYITNTFTF